MNDLGSYLPDLSHAESHLRLVAVHSQGRANSTHATNSVNDLDHAIPLDSHDVPAAMTIDIARVFPSGPEATS